MRRHLLQAVAAIGLIAGSVGLSAGAHAAGDPASCKNISFSNVGWTDISATTGTATYILDALGYKTTTTILSVPVTFEEMTRIADLWVEAAFKLEESDLKRMERLVTAQERRVRA